MDLYVEKDTDLMRSTFVAIGLAALFERLAPPGSGYDVRLRDLGSAYHVSVPYTLDEAHAFAAASADTLSALIPAIRKVFSQKEQKELQANPDSIVQHKYVPRSFSGEVVEYEKEQEIAKAAPKKMPKDARQEGDAPQAAPDYPLWAHLCSYFGKGSAMRVGYPNVLHAWHAHRGDTAHALLDLIVGCYGDYPNDIEALHEAWETQLLPALEYADYALRPMISSLAVVSPSTAKGVSTTAGAQVLTEGTPEEFWLVIYLAFAGFMIAGMPFTMGSDVLTYYPLPRDISLGQLRAEMDEYRSAGRARQLYSFSNQMARAKLDALAQITFYQSMVAHFRTASPSGLFADWLEAHSGLVGYYYKDIGGTQIPFDETLFALPRWLPNAALNDTPALDEAAALLEAHHAMIFALRGKAPKYALTADELVVLNAYRSFITTGEMDAWIDFAIRYNAYRFRALRDFYMPDLHIDILERTIMNIQDDKKDYRPILSNEGFRNIAAAIRHCTVTTRYLEDVKKQDTGFKVRHGLGDDLLRNAHDADIFIEELSRFLHDYARESSSVQANNPERTRPFVTENDLYHLTELISIYGSRVVANLLVAVGFSSAYRKSDNS